MEYTKWLLQENADHKNSIRNRVWFSLYSVCFSLFYYKIIFTCLLSFRPAHWHPHCLLLDLCAGSEQATVPVRERAARRTCDLLISGSITRRWRWRAWRKRPVLPHLDMIRPSSPARTSPRSHTASQRARWAARAATQVQDDSVIYLLSNFLFKWLYLNVV